MADIRMLADLPEQARVARRIWPYLRPHRGALGLAVAVSLLSTLALTLVPAAIGTAVDRIEARDRDGLIWYSAAVIVLVVARMLLLRQAEILLTRAGERVVRDLRERAVERLGRAPLRFVEAHRDGDLLQRGTVEIAEVATFFRAQVPDLLSLCGYLLFSTVMLVGYSWQLFLLVLVVFGGPMFVLGRLFRRAADRVFPAEATAEATVAGTLQEGLGAREQLQVAGATRVWSARLRRDTDAYHRAVRATQRAVSWVEGTWLVQGAATAVLLVVGAYLVAGGDLRVGVVVVFLLATRDLFGAVDDLTYVAGELVETRVGLARLLDLLEAAAPPEGRPAGTPTPGSGGLEAHDIAFGYHDDLPVLHGLTLAFARGEHAGLVGETGSGKTTLAKILCGLYAPDRGTVRYAGVDLADLAPDELRRRIVLIPQQVHMISGTLADNLALTPGDPDRAAMRRAVDRLGLDGWVAGLPAGLDTDLGARGESFSAGERQLVGLLRAALIDPEVLVLDEATADIDARTATALETAIGVLHRDRTMIVIAHRPTTIERLPRTVALAAGRLVPAR
ncbi:ABC transporter ATP-binding protein [Longispora sp. NPDC051575]|uniref:ABC transporter ATP-binding protein n=1 Tax=Longispora sp. NPDC051575 TaxID=3154943 RepID=UPI003429DBDB